MLFKKLEFGRQIFKKYRGISAIEAAFVVPIFFAIIFFILELMFVNSAKTALLSIAVDATRDFAKFRKIDKFDEYVAKYQKKYAPRGKVKYYINLYDSLEAAMSDKVKGGEEIYWPDGNVYVDKNANGNFDVSDKKLNTTDYSRANVKGKFFVITFVMNYHFTNSLSKQFFGRGSNTKSNGARGDLYLLYTRGIGICE